MSYQGPGVTVEQKFETTAPVVAVENLPSVAVAAAFDVRSKEKLGTSIGVLDDVIYDWVKDSAADPVIYDDSFGTKLYTRYPVKVYARDTDLGEDVELTGMDTAPSATGACIDLDESYKIIDIESGDSSAVMPYFGAVTAALIGADTLNIVTCAAGTFRASGLLPGMEVVILESTNKLVGVIASVDSNQQITLAAPYSAAVTGTAIYIGAGAFTTTANFAAIKGFPAYIYDSTTDFIRSGIKKGDFVAVAAPELSASITTASIDSVLNANLIRIFTADGTTVKQTCGNQPADAVYGKLAYNLTDYYGSSKTATSICNVSAYSVSRFVGFSPKLVTTGMTTTGTGTISITITGGPLNLSVGDKVVLGTALTKVYTVTFVTTLGTVYKLDQLVTAADGVIYAWKLSDPTTRLSHDIVADYRIVKTDLVGQVFKSSDYQLVGTNGLYGEANVYNDLAFMISVAAGLNGNRVVYAVSIDPTETITTQYADALEALKFYNVYSHALGTNEAGVLATLPSYVDEQADPYEGHERTAVLAYDEDDVYNLGQDTAAFDTAGLMTATTSGYMTTVGLSLGDKIAFTDASDVDWEVTVTAMPGATTVQTDYDGVAITSPLVAVTYLAGVKSKQAQKIKALGAIANRRCTIIWPGTFTADTTATAKIPALTGVELPSYFLSAAIAGLDGGQKVSQSLTHLGFGVPGLSNIRLGTNSYFRRADLDLIGGGGIDILVQDNQVSNVIYSRHDLTTDMSAVELRERSVTKQADQTAKTFRDVIDPYVGKYNITDSLLKFIRMILSSAKTSLIKQGVVDKLEILAVQRDPEITDKVNVIIKVTVFIAGNYYDITLLVVSR